jgi:hypothetical protein
MGGAGYLATIPPTPRISEATPSNTSPVPLAMPPIVPQFAKIAVATQTRIIRFAFSICSAPLSDYSDHGFGIPFALWRFGEGVRKKAG